MASEDWHVFIPRKTVVDVGCGAGLFLDHLYGLARRTVGIDPAIFYKDYVEKKHEHFETINQFKGDQVDVVTSFDTLEHLSDPEQALREMHRILKPGGRIYIGVPNQRDFLKSICSDYIPFFYHSSHLFYFTGEALSRIMDKAGFHSLTTDYVHKYGMMNFVQWLRHGCSTKEKPKSAFDEVTERNFRSNVEREGISSHILVGALKR